MPAAREDAGDLVRLLRPGCARIAVAGSLRRGVAEPRDIDLVCVARTEPEPGDLFAAHDRDALDATIRALLSIPRSGLSRPRDAKSGPRQKELRFRGRKVELWIVRPPATWGVIYAIRTGDAEFARLLVTPTSQGGALPPDHQVTAGRLMHGSREVPTPEERELFAALGLPWIPPGRRTADELRRWIARRNSSPDP